MGERGEKRESTTENFLSSSFTIFMIISINIVIII